MRAILAAIGLAIASHASADTVELNLDHIQHGQLAGVDVAGGPFFIIRRSPEEIAYLKCRYAKSDLRSKTEDFIFIRNHGAGPTCVFWHAVIHNPAWRGSAIYESGGFVDSCTYAQYDLSGRLVVDPSGKGIKEIPIAPHYFKNSKTVVIGTDKESVEDKDTPNKAMERDGCFAAAAHD